VAETSVSFVRAWIPFQNPGNIKSRHQMECPRPPLPALFLIEVRTIVGIIVRFDDKDAIVTRPIVKSYDRPVRR
jgi:hypothetical protein